MSLDYQKSPYVVKRGDAGKRTSYGHMNRWLHHTQDDIPNPYASASEEGVFRSLRPVLNVPLQEYTRFPCSPQSARLTPRRGQMSSPQLYGGTPLFSQDRAYLDRAQRAGKIVVPPPADPGPASVQYYKSGGYDDFHKTFLQLGKLDMSPTYPHYGPPRLRAGRVGGSWRHVKEVLQAKGERTLFVDGVPRGYDNSRLLHGEIPAGNTIQSLYGSDKTVRLQPKKTVPWTRHDLEAFKASEGANWSVMR